MTAIPASVDVLIVGSGPAGSTFAREIQEAMPEATVLMVEMGPRLTDLTGFNVRNLPPDERVAAQHLAEQSTGLHHSPSSATGSVDGRLAARPGTSLVNADADPSGDGQDGMPAAAVASNVGGMGAHWTCACPKPAGGERIAFLGAEFDAAFARAEELLDVTTTAFPRTGTTDLLLRALGEMVGSGRAPDRMPQPMPLACRPTGGPLPQWSGTSHILEPLGDGRSPGPFVLADNTLCRRLLHTDGTITGAELLHRPTGEVVTVDLRAAVVAADALRTPQLLWASGIRPAALGHFLNDQPQIVAAFALDDRLIGDDTTASEAADDATTDLRDELVGVLWIPYHEPELPYHTQIMQLGTAPIELADATESRNVIGYGRFVAKELRAEDCVTFAEEPDTLGMPTMTIHYDLSDRDRATIDTAMQLMDSEVRQLGTFLPGATPRLLPAGSSMHYQGSVRMGLADDGTSVCDVTSKVWGTSNLFVGGNGVIPTATACNPTATSVALCVLSAPHVVAHLKG